MTKNKLRRFQENATFSTMIQPSMVFPPVDHAIKGNWKKDFFKNFNPIVLELGCGRGEYTISLAQKFPDKNFIGIDWKGARLWRGAKTAHEEKMVNAGFLRIQIQNLAAFFGEGEVDEIWITFPDPQMEKSREKKRLTSPRYLNLYRQLMSPNGVINLKTDSKPFYDYTLERTQEEKLKVLQSTDDLYSTIPDDEILSIKTTYERMWLAKGIKICYLQFYLFPDEKRKA